MTAQQAVQKFTPILAICNGQPATTSLNIAQVFDKKHQHVLEAIKKLEVPEEFSRSNFRPSNYLDDRGKEQPMYHITRDGFTILAMGFTGQRAMQFKLAYIEAFNSMEASIAHAHNLRVSDLDEARLQGARAGYALKSRLENSGKGTFFVRRLIKYRNLGLSQVEASRCLRCTTRAAREWENMIRSAGLWAELETGNINRIIASVCRRPAQLALFAGGAA